MKVLLRCNTCQKTQFMKYGDGHRMLCLCINDKDIGYDILFDPPYDK